MANKVKWGVRNLHYATRTVSGTPETVTYGTPVKIAGTVNISLSPEGEDTPFYADDMEYFRVMANNGYSGTIELAKIPTAFRKLALGEEVNADGVIEENADAQGSEFALGFEVQGDAKPLFIWFYNVVASRPDINAATKEASVTPQTDTLNIVCRPEIDGYVCRRTDEDTDAAVVSAWFTSVYTG